MQTIHGCDSVAILITEAGFDVIVPMQKVICEGESYAFGSQNLSESGVYTHVVNTAGGCDSIFQLSLSVSRLVLDLGPDLTLSLGQSVRLNPVLSGGPAQTWVWSDTRYLSCSNCWTPDFAPLESGLLSLVVQDPYGCTAEDALVYVVRPEPRIFVPNIFSPNGDGQNDYLTVFGGAELERVAFMRVFDRWGEMLYEGYDLTPNSLNSGWDGSFRGREMNPGVFVWVIRVVLIDGSEMDLSGDVTLTR